MTKLETVLKNFSDKPDVLKHIDEADKLKTRDAIKEYYQQVEVTNN